MKKRFRDYQEKLLEDLQDEDEASAYLQAAFNDQDPRIFLRALNNVIIAQKRTAKRKIKISKTSINKSKSTYDEFVESLTPQQKKKFDEEYRDLLLSELILADKYGDKTAVHELAKMLGIKF